MQWLKRTWKDNGTKLIGYVTFAVGVLGSIDAFTMQEVTKLVGPKIGGQFALICMIATGLTTAWRGHKNTAAIAQQTVDRASTGQVIASAEVVTAAAKTAVAADDKSQEK